MEYDPYNESRRSPGRKGTEITVTFGEYKPQ